MMELAFFIFCMGFFMFVMQWCTRVQDSDRERKDLREDLAYHRMLAERREFGYTSPGEHINPPKRNLFRIP